MWVSSKLVDLFSIGKDTVDSLRKELEVIRVERDILKQQVLVAQNNFEWSRSKVNSLEMERTALMEKAYNIKLPTPQILKQPVVDPTFDPANFSFSDVGEQMAKQLGLPSYDTNYHDAH